MFLVLPRIFFGTLSSNAFGIIEQCGYSTVTFLLSRQSPQYRAKQESFKFCFVARNPPNVHKHLLNTQTVVQLKYKKVLR